MGGDNYEEFEAEVAALMQRWPKSSGSDAYPVPAPSHYNPPGEWVCVSLAHKYFWECRNRAARWDANTEYGASRRELLTWMLEQTKGNCHG